MRELREHKMMLFCLHTCDYSLFYGGLNGHGGTYMTSNFFWFRGVGINTMMQAFVQKIKNEGKYFDKLRSNYSPA